MKDRDNGSVDNAGGFSLLPPSAKKPRRVPPSILQVHLFPRKASSVPQYRLGDTVYSRPKSTVDSGFGSFQRFSDCSSKNALVSFDDGSCRLVPSHRLVPVVAGSQRRRRRTNGAIIHVNQISIIVTEDTHSFRQTARTQLQQSQSDVHHVLELGCSTGETSEIIWRHCNSWVGFDTSATMIQTVKHKFHAPETDTTRLCRRATDLFCERLDALVDPLRARQVACRFNDDGPTDVFLDIGGDRAEGAVWRMLHFLCVGDRFPALEQIVVKSEELHKRLWNDCSLPGRDGPFRISQLSFERDEHWIREHVGLLVEDCIQKMPKHPRKAPIRMSPWDGVTPVCRYHNYHSNGCAKNKDKECPFDHVHCHWCLQPGHTALNCACAPSSEI